MSEKPVDFSKTNKADNELDEYEEWKKYTLGGEKYAAYLPRLKYELDKEAAIRAAELREIAAEKKGIEKGRELGREEGREEGIEEGLARGKNEERVKIVGNLFSKGMKTVEIAEITQLTEEQVKELIDDYDPNS